MCTHVCNVFTTLSLVIKFADNVLCALPSLPLSLSLSPLSLSLFLSLSLVSLVSLFSTCISLVYISKKMMGLLHGTQL